MGNFSPNTLSASFVMLFLLSYQPHFSTSASENAPSKVYIVYMGERQHSDPSLVVDSHHNVLATVLGGSKEAAADSIIYNYKHGFSGFAVRLTDSQAKMIAEMPGVVHVTPNGIVEIQTTRSWDYLGLSLRLEHSDDLLAESNMGDGIIIGVIDSGVWPESRSYSDEGLEPIHPGRWKGECEEGDHFSSTNCNMKLIGARSFSKGRNSPINTAVEYLSPRDADGHGTHCSSTAAGSLVHNASYEGLGLGTVRGGAPRARLAIYKALWKDDQGGASGTHADILSAFDAAIGDGVDVLSVSIGPTNRDPSSLGSMSITIGSFHAVARGITVVCSAGNQGPSPYTVQKVVPWIISVAASTMDRSFPSFITLGNNQTVISQAIFTRHDEIGFTGIVCPPNQNDQNDCLCQFPLYDDSTMRGKVVLCFATPSHFWLSTIVNSLKIGPVGAAGVIIAKSPTQITRCHNISCVEVDYDVGHQILSYIRSSREPVVKLSPSKTLVSEHLSIKVADFSSRGPSSLAPEILKPDVAAPGVNILAAYRDGFVFNSGTSMACPHVAGIVALLKALHPNWSPAAIRSVLVTTASTTGPFGEPILTVEEPEKLANPFHYGGGIVDPNRAAHPGLIYDMGIIDYVYYLCSLDQYDTISKYTAQSILCPSEKPSWLNLNLPSITVPNLRGSVTVIRTVTNVGPINSRYIASVNHPPGVNVEVKPDMLIFDKNVREHSFEVTLSSDHKVIGGYNFGSLIWSDGVHTVTSPMSVKTEIIPSYTDRS